MTGGILSAVKFFQPYLILCFVLAAGFGLSLFRQFRSSNPAASRNVFSLISEATSFFFMFSIFGVVTSYFLSLGIREVGGIYVNPMVEAFVTPLVALLTAGVGYIARRNSDGKDSMVVPAGVICFLLVCLLSYRSFYLAQVDRLVAFANSAAEESGNTVEVTVTQ